MALVVPQVDSAIHWINHYPADSMVFLLTLIRWIAIYTVDSLTQTSNNWGQTCMINCKITTLFLK